MTDRRSVPPIPRSALRDHVSEARLTRGWERIEAELVQREPRAHVARRSWWWAPAAALALFGSGVFVGTRWSAPARSALERGMRAEPMPAAEAPTAPAEPRDVAPPSPSAAPKKREPQHLTPLSLAPAPPVELAPTPSSVVVTAPVIVVARWRTLASAGDFVASRRAIDELGGFAVVMERATAEELMTLSDVARASGEHGIRLVALRRVYERFPGNANAPIAAYQVSLLLEKAGDRAGAKLARDTAIRLSPSGDLAEDALARDFDDAVKSGDLERARALFSRHEREHPQGRRRAELGAKLARLVEAKGSPDGGAFEPDPIEDEADEPSAVVPPAPAASGSASPR